MTGPCGPVRQCKLLCSSRTSAETVGRCTQTSIWTGKQVGGWCRRWPTPPEWAKLFCSCFSFVQLTAWAVARKLDCVARDVTPVASSRKHPKTPSSKICVTRRVIAITRVSSWTTAVPIIARRVEVNIPVPSFILFFFPAICFYCSISRTLKSRPTTVARKMAKRERKCR